MSREKMHNGEIYYPNSEEISKDQLARLDRLFVFNHIPPSEKQKRCDMMKEMFAEVGERCYLESPFYSSFGGGHIHFGNHVYCNFGCTFVDDTHIYVGDRCMFGPNVVVATAAHPILPELRLKGYQFNMPVHIGNNCWIGAGAIILPGVTIGENTVIGAGSVVTKDIPANVVAVGNPCRVMREIGEHDRAYYYKDRKLNLTEL